MRSDIFTVALLLFSTTPALSAPHPVTDIQYVARDDAVASIESRDTIFGLAKDLWKRKGGGGGGGKGGGSSSSSSSSGSSSSSSSSSSGKGGSSSSSSSSSTSSTNKGSSSSNAGGSTKTGSGVQPGYGGGRYYGGGATTPYSAGRSSPLGIAPVFLGVGALAVFPGIWLYGAYSYPYSHQYSYYNRSGRRNTTNTRREVMYAELTNLITRQDSTTGANETKSVNCLCAMYAVCGCDDNGNSTFIQDLIGDGSYAGLNKSLINIVDINGTSTVVLNGTLPNGTTIADASSTDSATGAASSTFGPSLLLIVGLVSFSVYII